MSPSRGALGAAYLVAMGWVCWRDVKIYHRLPQPRNIIRGSALYALLGIMAPLITDPLAAGLGWGILVATIIHDQGKGPESSPPSSLPDLLDPNGGKVPQGSTPPPGTPPGIPPYAWGLVPGVPDPGTPPPGYRAGVQFTSYIPAAGLVRRTINV